MQPEIVQFHVISNKEHPVNRSLTTKHFMINKVNMVN